MLVSVSWDIVNLIVAIFIVVEELSCVLVTY